jgi:predicted secreted hydrolase
VRRPLLVVGTVVLALLAAAAASAARKPHVVLPRDHLAHPGASIEWWYFTALVHDSSGTPYSVFFTLFSSQGGVVPVSQVMNLRTGALVGHTEGLGVGPPAGPRLDVRASGTRLRYLASGAWAFSVSTADFGVSLVQRPLKPYTLHGDGGLVRQGPAGLSHYYSSTRMSATGTLRTGTATVPLRGQSWFDHQWGGFRDDRRGFNWDWFSCRFDDDTELMLYQFLDPVTHAPLDGYRAGSYVGPKGSVSHLTAFTATPGARVLTDTGIDWPLDWTLQVGSPALSETVTSLLPDQLVRNQFLPTFWEGAASAGGTKSGTCFVEVSYR